MSATATRFALDESAARAFIARALRRYASGDAPAGAAGDEIELAPGWNPREMIYDETWLADYLVSEAFGVDVITGPHEIELVGTPDMEGGMYFWRISGPGHFAICSPYREETRRIGSGRTGALGALDLLREAVDMGNQLLGGLDAYVASLLAAQEHQPA